MRASDSHLACLSNYPDTISAKSALVSDCSKVILKTLRGIFELFIILRLLLLTLLLLLLPTAAAAAPCTVAPATIPATFQQHTGKKCNTYRKALAENFSSPTLADSFLATHRCHNNNLLRHEFKYVCRTLDTCF